MSEAAVARYRPGALSRFLGWMDSLPGHGWWLPPAIGLLWSVWSTAVLWITGLVPVGSFEPEVLVAMVYGPYSLLFLAYLNRVAVRSLATFWPATGWSDSERPAWAYEFVTSPSGFGLAALVIAVALAVGAFLAAPVAAFLTLPAAAVGPQATDRAALFVAYAPSLFFGYGLLPLAIVHSGRQLRLVSRIHHEATAIDPFDRAPIYAFSRLTVLTGLAYVLVGYYTLTFNASFQTGNLVSAAALSSAVVLGIACFIVPLWGIHGRLVHEKDVLREQVEDRIGRLGAEMFRRIDGGEFDQTKVISDGLAGTAVLRDRIDRLPTWPWPPQLLRGFVSALLLPVIVYLISRLVGGRIGA